MSEIQHYVLFPNHDNAMRLHRELKAQGIKAVIAPTPRAASKCCGVSLLVQAQDVEAIQACVKAQGIEILKIAEIERDVNPKRDRYC
ncbi:MAG: DUF3343 domain-containing protein [Dorea sp.]|jgi:hypothetical protein|nr:DUF3343 domain-containing protein [Dorea sp.]